MQLRLICALATAAALAPPAPRLAKQPKRLKTRRILTEDVVVYAGDDELEGDAKVGSAGFRQLVGFRGAADTEDEPLWKIRIQLTKPGTWVPLIWGVACGAAASGNYRWPFISGTFAEGAEDFAKAATCMILSGPFLTGFCQTINDWYDKVRDSALQHKLERGVVASMASS